MVPGGVGINSSSAYIHFFFFLKKTPSWWWKEVSEKLPMQHVSWSGFIYDIFDLCELKLMSVGIGGNLEFYFWLFNEVRLYQLLLVNVLLTIFMLELDFLGLSWVWKIVTLVGFSGFDWFWIWNLGGWKVRSSGFVANLLKKSGFEFFLDLSVGWALFWGR